MSQAHVTKPTCVVIINKASGVAPEISDEKRMQILSGKQVRISANVCAKLATRSDILCPRNTSMYRVGMMNPDTIYIVVTRIDAPPPLV